MKPLITDTILTKLSKLTEPVTSLKIKNEVLKVKMTAWVKSVLESSYNHTKTTTKLENNHHSELLKF